MRRNYKGPECPECGSFSTRQVRTGHDNEGRLIRARRCLHCGQKFGTIEIFLPAEFDFHATDVYSHNRSKYAARWSEDEVIYTGTVKIKKGSRTNWCRKALHRYTAENTRIDSVGRRSCNACVIATRRRYREENRETLNAKQRDRAHANKELMLERQRRYRATHREQIRANQNRRRLEKKGLNVARNVA